MKKQKTRFGHIDIPLERVHLELTNICEFNCVFCPKDEMTRRPGYMDTALAKRLITEIGDNNIARKVTLHVMGEPTLHKDFFDILSHAREAGVDVGLTTNGAGLGKDAGRKLLDYELYQLDVSLQTPDEESFKLRKSGALQFKDYLAGVLSFFSKYKARWPETIFKFRFMNTRFPSKALEAKAGPVRVISSTAELRETFSNWAERIYDMLDVHGPKRQEALKRINGLSSLRWNVVEVYPKVFFETYVLGEWSKSPGDPTVRDAWAGYCYGMRTHFAVLHSGDLVLCCQDFDGHTAVGNVTDSSLKEVLSSARVGEIMEGFKRMKLVHPYCKRCLGSRGTASWLLKPVGQVLALKTLKPLFYRQIKLIRD